MSSLTPPQRSVAFLQFSSMSPLHIIAIATLLADFFIVAVCDALIRLLFVVLGLKLTNLKNRDNSLIVAKRYV
jgi:hypothetical protein